MSSNSGFSSTMPYPEERLTRTAPNGVSRVIISRESVRVDGIVREMLELSRLETHRDALAPEQIRAGDFFGKLKERFMAHCAERQPEYLEQYEPEEVFFGDFRMLIRAVFNLLKNAYAYGDQERLRIEVAGVRKLTHYEISVFNTGHSIPPEEKDSLWDPFVKADQARSRGIGSGIGLSIVREIVEAHHGYYDIRNIADGVQFVSGIPLEFLKEGSVGDEIENSR